MTPALLTMMSNLPRSLTVEAMIPARAPGSVTSPCTADALPPASSIVLTTSADSLLRRGRSTMVTSAPKEARPLAMAAPMPLPAPVIMAIFPLRSMELVAMNPSFPDRNLVVQAADLQRGLLPIDAVNPLAGDRIEGIQRGHSGLDLLSAAYPARRLIGDEAPSYHTNLPSGPTSGFADS